MDAEGAQIRFLIAGREQALQWANERTVGKVVTVGALQCRLQEVVSAQWALTVVPEAPRAVRRVLLSREDSRIDKRARRLHNSRRIRNSLKG